MLHKSAKQQGKDWKFYLLKNCCAAAADKCSVVSDSLRPHGLQPARLLCPWDFSRQEYCSGLPCPPPGDLPDPQTEPRSLVSAALTGRFFTTRATWEPLGIDYLKTYSGSKTRGVFSQTSTISIETVGAQVGPGQGFWAERGQTMRSTS